MSTIYRTLVGLVSLGAGVVSIGLGTGLPLPALVTLSILGFAQLAFGLAVAAGATVREIYVAGALAPSALWLVLLLTDVPGTGGSLLTFALGASLNFVLALLIGAGLRFRWPQRELQRTSSFLALAAVVAALVGGVATPALAASTAGPHAREHSGMLMDMGPARR